MASTFRPAQPGDRASIIRFLQEVFQASGGEPSLSAPQMRWKYEDSAAPHAWSCRNFVLARDDGRILAHAGVWPVQLLHGGRRYPGVHLIDWAGAADAPGAGVSLLQKIARDQHAVIFGLGGSEMTRRIFPAVGFRPLARIGSYARPLRPWRQIRTHQHRGQWKTPLRLARNTWWSRRPPAEPDSWSASAGGPESCLWPQPLATAAVCARDAGGFRYLARCPVIETRFYTLRNGANAAGYFLLAFVPGQARIADAWTPSEDPGDWRRLYALAEAEALRNPDVAEVTTIAGLPAARSALAAGGFHLVKEEDLMVYDARRILPAVDSVHFQLVDNDACYLHSGAPSYLT